MAAPVTIEEQLEMPSERGRQIGDEAKAKEGLLDIGFLSLGGIESRAIATENC